MEDEDDFWTFRPSKAEELKARIREAFAEAVYPGNDNITISACSCGECTETRAFFEGKHWRDVAATGQPFQIGWGGLANLSPDAWRFYLPAYMLLSLKGDGDPGETLECALYSLSPHPTIGNDLFTERMNAFSIEQQKCIAAYACAAVEPDEEDKVFDEAYVRAASYWKSKVAGIKAEQSEA